MSLSEDYKQKRADYERLKAFHGGADVSDYCGAWCNNDMMTSMLENPTKRNAMEMYSSLITVYGDQGYEPGDGSISPVRIDTLDPEIYEILKRNGDKD